MLQLVADRFAVIDTGETIDLASGSRVHLVVTPAADAAGERRWAARCARLAELRHRALAVLVDYGALGTARRFEAWRCESRSRGSTPSCDEGAIARASAFLGACALTTGSLSATSLYSDRGTAVVVPAEDTGFDLDRPSTHEFPSVDAYGIQLLVRRAVPAVCDLFSPHGLARPRILGLWGPSGSGLETAIREIARTARLMGYVPVSAHLDRRLLRLVADRTRLMIVRGAPDVGWPCLLGALMEAPGGHVLLFAGEEHVPHVEAIALERCAPELLIGAIRPELQSTAIARRFRTAARRARGMPGRFSVLLWGERRRDAPHSLAPSRVAEGAALYGIDGERPASHAVAEIRPWPAPGELAVLRRRMDAALAQLARGRHAPANRALRQTVAALTRRHDWTEAARGATALATSLLRRGRTREAVASLAEVKEWALGGRHNDVLMDIAVITGVAATDDLRLDDAEAILHGALAAARAVPDRQRTWHAGLALARCAFWRGRYGDARAVLSSPEFDDAPTPIALRTAILRGRSDVGSGDLVAASTHIATAQQLATEISEPALAAAAAVASAFIHLTLGDYQAAESDAAASISYARAARDPLAAIRARLIGAEAARRAAKPAVAAAMFEAVRRVHQSQLSPILRERCALVAQSLAHASSAARRAVERANATGLHALPLFFPVRMSGSGALQSAVTDVVDILRCCQTADEDLAVLAAVCARLRVRLQAAGVTWFVADGDSVVPIAADGSRIDFDTARRILTLEQTIPPHRVDERIEGGAPVRYAGRLAGAVVVRWNVGASIDATTAAVLMTMAAAAAGPALAAVATTRAAPAAGGTWELLGGSAAMDEVRRAVERAAAAPFPVLIDGESGCGKELVARALHRRGPRRDRAFCTLNCAALPDDLVESELFGHTRGAFTGAAADRSGVFEEAHSGTLFLDEIGELSLRAQAKVLRAVQDGEIRRLGDNMPRRVDVRLVAATNRDLRQEVAAGRFRLDLLYRLDVIRISVPPLRDRRDDIPLLAEHFWREATARVGSKATLGSGTLAALARYDWPGNVRELQNVLAALAVRTSRRGVIAPTALPPSFDSARPDASWRLDEARRTFERRFIRAALARSGGRRAGAAEELGVTRQGLTKLMVRLGIEQA